MYGTTVGDESFNAFVRELEEEARALAALNHPNIVKVHGVVHHRTLGHPEALVLELADRTLDDLLRRPDRACLRFFVRNCSHVRVCAPRSCACVPLCACLTLPFFVRARVSEAVCLFSVRALAHLFYKLSISIIHCVVMSFMRAGPLTMLDVWGITKDVLSGLTALHAVPIFHRDVKPNNVLVFGTGDELIVKLGACGSMPAR